MLDSLLTLDQSTLFYWTLSDSSKKRKHRDVVDWAAEIPGNAKPASRASSHIAARSHIAASRSKSGVPSLTAGTSRSSAPSVLTNGVRIIVSRGMTDSAKVKAETAPEITIMSNGGLSDNDETNGEERLAAVNSPPKGKKRVDSNVSPFLVPTLYSSNCYPQSSNLWSKNPAKRHPKKLEVRSFRIMSRQNGSGIHSSRRIWSLSVKLRTLGMCLSGRQLR